jgi:hypothetical protein
VFCKINYTLFTPNPGEPYYSEEENIFYIRYDVNVSIDYLADCIRQQLAIKKGYDLKDMSKLIRILNLEPQNINTLLDSLRVRPLKNTVIIEEGGEDTELAPITSLEGDFEPLDRSTSSAPSSPPQNDVNHDENKPKKFVNITPSPNATSNSNEEGEDDDTPEPKTKGYDGQPRKKDQEGSNRNSRKNKPSDLIGKRARNPSSTSETKDLDPKDSNDQKSPSLPGLGRPFSGRVDVEHQDPTKEESNQHNSDERLAIEKQGISIILDYEASEGRKAKFIEGNNAGYDIESIELDGSMRYIEAKTFSGEWPKFGGVKLSDVQFRKAQEEQNNFGSPGLGVKSV